MENLEQLKLEVEHKWNECQIESRRLEGEHRLLIKLLGDKEQKPEEENNATN